MTTVATEVKKLTMVQAITDAMRTMMREDESVLVLGEDVGVNGGVFRATDGLVQEFGEERVVDTPLAESGIIGTSVGLAVNGFKPICEMQFFGFIYPAFNQIMTHATRMRQRSLGRYTVPMVIRAPYGAGVKAPEIHSDSVEALFTHIPGLKVVTPSNAYDAKGLLIASIKDPDPVLFIEPMRCYRTGRTEVPEDNYSIPLGKASTVKEGNDVTILTWGAMVQDTVQAVQKWESAHEATCEIIDLRTLYPLDKEAIKQSVEKTGRVVVVHEAPETGGVSGDIISVINDAAFFYLKAPVQKVTGFDTPVPVYSLEQDYLPSARKVTAAVEHTLKY
ncbi:2-oxoisovalerate dehydrogenase subunit beta [Halobacillus andaensis]|uniref:2-oxoisovalerate dehydrogenase subunit beta n=1 Tax=Halobacillus andaensis TaxID=1176239 RepID=A0A917EW01_HALAA|nr:alpha-ketoacid dehydrogenase subunit beta [Halobacillus andaensis]MBP2003907.1 pyruvate dehydrogenase E1 component beta subunit [Halobacillus andaensis]GGF14199.1 2-oxoisovalerate dehydrogenase subunit beta [Halobacillus andaensis]